MTKRPRRNHSADFKGASGMFGGEAKSEPAAPAVDVKTLHARIGELVPFELTQPSICLTCE